MTFREFDGKNVEKALDKASNKLHTPKDRLKYEILSYGSSGIFGLAGTKKARIRVKLKDEATQSVPQSPILDPVKDAAIEDIDERALRDRQPTEPDLAESSQPYEFAEDALDIGRDVLQRIIDAITSDAKITQKENSDGLLFNIAGGNAAVLIGKRGQTLEAIQSLVEKVVNKHNHNDNRIRVQVDVEGYLKTRRENLEQLANRLAEKAQRIRKPISMGQMNAHDRRIVHLALKDNPSVRTKSRGEGYLRKLVIFPKQRSERKQKND